MARVRRFEHDQKNEIHTALRQCKDIKALKRLQALDMRARDKSNREIAEATGFHEQYITVLVSKYIQNGLESILDDKRMANIRRMSYEAESQFLEQFLDMAEAGQLVTAEKILQRFDDVTGRPSESTTVYRLLKRHGWRKVKPRPRHPGAANGEEINSSKKLRPSWKKAES